MAHLSEHLHESEGTERQKVHQDREGVNIRPARGILSQKAPSAKRCIKTVFLALFDPCGGESESTERQKVH